MIIQVKLPLIIENLILPKIKTSRPKKKVPYVIQTTNVFTLHKCTKKEETNLVALNNSNLPEKKSFKEDKVIESDNEIINQPKSLINDIPIVKTNNNFTNISLEQGYDNFKKLFHKQYQMITIIENSSAPIILNTYTVSY
jgi:hypothetical protein